MVDEALLEYEPKTQYDVPAVSKAIKLLNLLCQSDEALGVSEISRAIDLNKNMVFRLLCTLTAEGWVAQENGEPRYRITLRPFHVTSQPVRRMRLKDVATVPLNKLWRATGESTYLAILDEEHALYLEHLDGTHNVHIAAAVGGRYPLHCAAPGKVLLAYQPEDVFDRLARAGFARMTPNTLCDPDALRAHLAEVRRQGWAPDNEEFGRGILCFAAPIFDHRDTMVGAIGLSVISVNYTIEMVIGTLGPHVLAAAGEISRLLGQPAA